MQEHDRRRADSVGASVNALPLQTRIPVLGYWVALKDASERCSNSEATIDDDCPPKTTVYPLVLRSEFDKRHQERDFHQSKNRVVYDRICVVPLWHAVRIVYARL
jgi:hypothetical protein